MVACSFCFSSRRRHTRCALVTGVQTCALPIFVRTATFLFAAGQETTARLLAAALKHLAEHPEMQDQLRDDRSKIPDFLEEVLRVESPVKTDFRLTTQTTTVGGVRVAAEIGRASGRERVCQYV